MNTEALDKVAVIITCYNEGAYIRDALRSVLDQSTVDMVGAIIIADDGSNEETLVVLREIEKLDPRIKIIYGPGGKFQAAQRNLAVSLTSEPLIAFLDGDDYWVPEKLELQLSLLAEKPNVGLVYSGFFSFSDGLKSSAVPSKIHDLSNAKNLATAYFLNDPPILPSTVLIRRDLYEQVGGMDETIVCFEETDFYLKIAHFTRFEAINRPLLYKRVRASSITGGRTDLMAHHAYVAFKAASVNLELMPLVPKRLSERARKLANQRFRSQLTGEAVQLASLAVRLDPMNMKAWSSWIVFKLFPTVGRRVFGTLPRSSSEMGGHGQHE